MQPSIFISHSCKDREREPPAGLDAAGRRERADRLGFARRVRDRLFAELQASGRYAPWLDVRTGLRGGDVWRDGIHRGLRDCAGAVLLLSPESLESGWVLKETIILSWRAALGEPVTVIPLLLGVGSRDLARHGFDPSGIAAFQSEVVDRPTMAECDRVVARIVATFDARVRAEPRRPGRWSTTVEKWLAEMARQLRQDDDPRYLREMFDVFGVDPDDHEYDDPYLEIAQRLLDTGPDEILKVLHVLSGVRHDQEKQLLRQFVAPLWVAAGAAHRLPHVAARPILPGRPRIAAIDAVEPVTGEDYVQRAYCGKLPSDRVFTPDDHTDGSVEQILARIEHLLAEYLPVDVPAELDNDIQRNGAVYVVLGPAASRGDVLAELTRRYPPLTFVALTGRDPAGLGAFGRQAEFITPPLGVGETAGRRYRNRLTRFA